MLVGEGDPAKAVGLRVPGSGESDMRLAKDAKKGARILAPLKGGFILSISDERRDCLRSWWQEETEDAYTEAWRYELTDEEQALVSGWDSEFDSGFEDLIRVLSDAASEAKPH